MREVVEIHRVEVADRRRRHVIEDDVLIHVLLAAPVLDLVDVAVLLVLIVVVVQDPEQLKENELLMVKNDRLMTEGPDLYHQQLETILNVVILVHLLVLVKKLEKDLQAQMIVMAMALLVLHQGVHQHVFRSLEVPNGIELNDYTATKAYHHQ